MNKHQTAFYKQFKAGQFLLLANINAGGYLALVRPDKSLDGHAYVSVRLVDMEAVLGLRDSLKWSWWLSWRAGAGRLVGSSDGGLLKEHRPALYRGLVEQLNRMDVDACAAACERWRDGDRPQVGSTRVPLREGDHALQLDLEAEEQEAEERRLEVSRERSKRGKAAWAAMLEKRKAKATEGEK